MPSVRSFILLAVLVFVLSIGLAWLSMLRPRDSGGRAADTYGTRAHGHRAVFEILDELHIPVIRRLPPPVPSLPTGHTLVFLAPHRNLVGVEPTYLQTLHDWIDGGGRVVIAPQRIAQADDYNGSDGNGDRQWNLPDIFESLNLADVSILSVDVTSDAEASSALPRRGASHRRPANGGDLADGILDQWFRKPRPTRLLEVEATGSLDRLQGVVASAAVPGDFVNVIEWHGETKPAGTLSYTDAEDVQRYLVAHFPRGTGEIVLIADPSLLTNRFIAEADNSVLAVHLLAPAGQTVVFDEFYHGLIVRGNPLYLLTRPGYATVFVAVLLAVGIWTWREAIFLGPPLPDAPSPRRDVGEYIAAMARFFHRGRRSRIFLLREVRDGVLNQLCQQLSLPPETPDTQAVITALARRDPARAAQLDRALVEVDDRLEHPQHCGESQIRQSMQRITACL